MTHRPRAIGRRLRAASAALRTGEIYTAAEHRTSVEQLQRRLERAEAKAELLARRVDILKDRLQESRAATRQKVAYLEDANARLRLLRNRGA
jgi:chaperonin cofactor prefoldin